MNDINPAFVMPDVQSSLDTRQIPIERVGVRGVRYPLSVKTPNGVVAFFRGRRRANGGDRSPRDPNDQERRRCFGALRDEHALPAPGTSSTNHGESWLSLRGIARRSECSTWTDPRPSAASAEHAAAGDGRRAGEDRSEARADRTRRFEHGRSVGGRIACTIRAAAFPGR